MNKIQEQMRLSADAFFDAVEIEQVVRAARGEGRIVAESAFEFMEKPFKKSQEALIRSIIEELKENGVGICAHAYNNAIIDVKNILTKSLEK